LIDRDPDGEALARKMLFSLTTVVAGLNARSIVTQARASPLNVW
jgi:hypothetical protein